MTTLEIQTAIATAEEIGKKSAITNNSRVPHHNDVFRNFLYSLDVKEATSTNFKISAKITKAFANSYTMQLLKMAKIN
jgi:hypothetical protein